MIGAMTKAFVVLVGLFSVAGLIYWWVMFCAAHEWGMVVVFIPFVVGIFALLSYAFYEVKQ